VTYRSRRSPNRRAGTPLAAAFGQFEVWRADEAISRWRRKSDLRENLEVQRRRKRLQNEYSRLLAQGQRDDQREAGKEILDRIDAIRKEIGWVQTSRIIERAEKLGVPMLQLLEKDDSWAGDRTFSFYPCLREEAKFQTIELIRKEKRARLEDRML
jgi:hypothetical protein